MEEITKKITSLRGEIQEMMLAVVNGEIDEWEPEDEDEENPYEELYDYLKAADDALAGAEGCFPASV
jgi:hypothetical protein